MCKSVTFGEQKIQWDDDELDSDGFVTGNETEPN